MLVRDRLATSGATVLLNQLVVQGPDAERHDFIGTMQGSGFLDWRPDWHAVAEDARSLMLANGAPSVLAAETVAARLRERWWWDHEHRRLLAERDPFGCPLDLNSLIPVPKRILRGGFRDGSEWLMANWGTPWPLRKVRFRLLHTPLGEGRVRPVLLYRFQSLDWSPTLAIAAMRARWAGLSIGLKVDYGYAYEGQDLDWYLEDVDQAERMSALRVAVQEQRRAVRRPIGKRRRLRLTERQRRARMEKGAGAVP